MLYIQEAERNLLEKASASCIPSPSQIRSSSRKCLLRSIFPPQVSLVNVFSSCAYNSRGHTHLVSAECSVLCFLKTFLNYQIPVFGLPYPPNYLSLFPSNGAVFSQ